MVIKARVHTKAIQAVRSDKQANANPIGINTCATRTKPNLKERKEEDCLEFYDINSTWCIIIPYCTSKIIGLDYEYTFIP